MNKKLIIANWKMNPQTFAEAKDILDSVNDFLSSSSGTKITPLVFCPPFIFIEEIEKIINNSQLKHFSQLGAQDIFWEDAGSDTGEISGPMLKKLGVNYVIIGHSERRWKIGETDEVVKKKLKAALRNAITPIVCIGEKNRDESFKNFLINQIKTTFSDIDSEELKKCLIVYEPVWAISSNPGARPDTPESAIESIEIIKEALSKDFNLNFAELPSVLYGGSVSSTNVIDFLSQDQIRGVLIGSASVNKIEFLKILNLIHKTT